MSTVEHSGNLLPDEILGKIESLEKRVVVLENEIRKSNSRREILSEEEEEESNMARVESSEESEKRIEGKIGEFGLAWLGNLVLLLGLAFLLQYVQNSGKTVFSTVLGYIASGAVFLVAYYTKKSFQYLSKMFGITGHLLLYFVTFRMFYFSAHPLVHSPAFVLILLMILLGVQIFISVRKKSEIYAVIMLLLAALTAVFSNSTHFMLSLMVMMALVSVFLFFRMGWWRLLFLSQFLVYISYLIWILSNPFMNRPMQLVTAHHFTYLYLFGVAVVYSMINFIKKERLISEPVIYAAVIFNGFSFTAFLILLVNLFFSNNYVEIFSAIFLFCFVFSIFLKFKSTWKASPSIYALYSFVSLSIALYGIRGLPFGYLLLSVESLLVIIMALWFRSRLIVVMNIILYLSLLFAYFFTSDKMNAINFSFAIVGLVSARILNWKKERLEIKTDLMRNIYMIAAFMMVLFALYKAFPVRYVTFSWIGAALFYFLLSIILKNIKYRWMAIFTFIASALHIFIVDLANIEMVYRIMVFLVLAVISIMVSIYYNKRIKKTGE